MGKWLMLCKLCKNDDCFAITIQNDNAKATCGQSTRICPQNHSPVITRHQTRMINAYGNAQYFRHFHAIVGSILLCRVASSKTRGSLSNTGLPLSKVAHPPAGLSYRSPAAQKVLLCCDIRKYLY